MLEDLIKDIVSNNQDQKLLALAKVSSGEIAKKLKATPKLPMQNMFEEGELVTQIILGVAPSDGEPMTRYKYPEPGQPAMVVGHIHDPKITGGDKGFAGLDDIEVLCMDANGEIGHYVVASRYFRRWIDGEQTYPERIAWLEKQARG